MQRYLSAAKLLFASGVNSYRRLRRNSDAPINSHWGWEKRTVGLKVPDSGKFQPTKPPEGSAYRLAQTLPRLLPDALHQLRRAKPLRALLGEDFVDALVMVKEIEHRANQQVISSFEREHLLLNV
ncbi:MAG: hypothetical protein ACR2QH_10015 [Geminicoccaceae bacterium]